MKSRKFPSFDDAVKYCESKGTLKFFGREGKNFEYCVYTLSIGNKVYHVDIYNDGMVKVTHEGWRTEY